VLLAGGPAHAAVKAPRTAITATQQVRADAQQVRTDAAVSHDRQASRSYTVQRGDTLSSIAQRFYGNAAEWRRLYQANMPAIRNPDLIRPGQMLNLPRQMPATTTAYAPRHARPATISALSGTLGCAGLEELWEQAGGSHAEAVMAASIAMAESSGEQYATGPAGERGYWQIHPDHGALSTYNPLGNAKAAVIISDNGTNWNPWTTFITGAYHGRC
jgi:LysM repeat protein